MIVSGKARKLDNHRDWGNIQQVWLKEEAAYGEICGVSFWEFYFDNPFLT